MRRVELLGQWYRHVAKVAHVISKRFQAFLDSGVADGAWPHVHATPPRAQIDRRADNCDIAHLNLPWLATLRWAGPSVGLPIALYHERTRYTAPAGRPINLGSPGRRG